MIKTPQSHPDHDVVGRHWGAYSTKYEGTQVYYCESYDPAVGYWMVNVADPTDRHCISERAPWRTWWPAQDRGDHYWITQWCVKFPKPNERTENTPAGPSLGEGKDQPAGHPPG